MLKRLAVITLTVQASAGAVAHRSGSPIRTTRGSGLRPGRARSTPSRRSTTPGSRSTPTRSPGSGRLGRARAGHGGHRPRWPRVPRAGRHRPPLRAEHATPTARGLRQRWDALTLHSKVTLATTAALLASAMVVLGVLEWSQPRHARAHVVADQGAQRCLLVGHTRAPPVSTRSPRATCTPHRCCSRPGSCSSGAGSAGTSGGIKVGTFAILAMVIWSQLRGEREPRFPPHDPRLHPAPGDHRRAAGRRPRGGRCHRAARSPSEPSWARRCSKRCRPSVPSGSRPVSPRRCTGWTT